MSSWDLVSSFEKSKATNLIITLLDKKSMNFTELMKSTKSNPRTLSDRIKDLAKAKVISVEKLQNFPFTETIQLTKKGVEIAKRMKRVYSHSENSISERAKKLLYIINEAGGSIIGTTRMEKLPFLLEKKYDIQFDYHYNPMTYGPYSIELLDDIELLSNNGYLQIIEEFVPVKTDDGSLKETARRSYVLTKKGEEKSKRIKGDILPKIETALDFIHTYNRIALKSLLDYVHKKYPNYQKKR